MLCSCFYVCCRTDDERFDCLFYLITDKLGGGVLFFAGQICEGAEIGNGPGESFCILSVKHFYIAPENGANYLCAGMAQRDNGIKGFVLLMSVKYGWGKDVCDFQVDFSHEPVHKIGDIPLACFELGAYCFEVSWRKLVEKCFGHHGAHARARAYEEYAVFFHRHILLWFSVQVQYRQG